MNEQELRKLERKNREQGGIFLVPQEQVADFLQWMINLGELSEKERKQQIGLLFPETLEDRQD